MSVAVDMAGWSKARAAQPVLNVGDSRVGDRMILEASGALKNVPYTISWHVFNGTSTAMEALTAGAVDISAAGDAPFLFMSMNGLPGKSVAAFRLRGEGVAIIVPSHSSIRTVDDLKGRTVGLTRRGTEHQLLLAALDQAGISTNSIHIAYLQPDLAESAFLSGQIDAWALSEPYCTKEELQGARHLLDTRGYLVQFTYLVASDKAIASRRAEIADYIQRVSYAYAWARSHQEEVAKVWARMSGLSDDIARRVLAHRDPRPEPIETPVTDAARRSMELYARHGLAEGEFSVEKAFDASFRESVLAGIRQARADTDAAHHADKSIENVKVQ